MSLLLPLCRMVAVAISFAWLAELPIGMSIVFLLLLTAPICSWVALLLPSTPTVGAMVREILFGASLGASMALPLLAASLGGALSLSRVRALQTLFRLLVLAGLLLLSWERKLLETLGDSFVAAAPGHAFSSLSLEGIGMWVQEVFRWGSSLGWPLLMASILAEFLGGLVARVAPQISLQPPREFFSLLGLFASVSAILYTLQSLLQP